jgi:hexosaminidase
VEDMYRRLWATDFDLNERAINESFAYQKVLSLWVNDVDISPVRTLADVCTPIKGYKRLMGGMLANGKTTTNLTSPLVNIADMVHSDSEVEWDFRKAVASYLKDHKDGNLQDVKYFLQKWQNNKARFDAVSVYAPYPQQIKDLSDNLSAAAAIGLQALNGEGNKDDQLKQLQQMEKPSHDVQLAVLPEIEALVTGTLKPLPASYPMF